MDENVTALNILARRNDPEDARPTRVFMTGPAGAGKCKFFLVNGEFWY